MNKFILAVSFLFTISNSLQVSDVDIEVIDRYNEYARALDLEQLVISSEMLESNPELTAHRMYQLATIHIDRNVFLEARWILEKVFVLTPKNTIVLANLLYCHAQLDEYKEARMVGQALLDIEPDNVSALNILSIIANKFGDKVQALEGLERIVELEPDDSLHWYNVAVLYADIDRLQDAYDAFERCVESSNGKALELSCKMQVVEVGTAMGKYDRSEKICREILHRHPLHTRTLYLLEKIMKAKYQLDEARRLSYSSQSHGLHWVARDIKHDDSDDMREEIKNEGSPYVFELHPPWAASNEAKIREGHWTHIKGGTARDTSASIKFEESPQHQTQIFSMMKADGDSPSCSASKSMPSMPDPDHFPNYYKGFTVPAAGWEVPRIDISQMNSADFYHNYVKPRRPVIISGDTFQRMGWHVDKWNRKYLEDWAGTKHVFVQRRFDNSSQFGFSDRRVMTFSEFLSKIDYEQSPALACAKGENSAECNRSLKNGDTDTDKHSCKAGSQIDKSNPPALPWHWYLNLQQENDIVTEPLRSLHKDWSVPGFASRMKLESATLWMGRSPNQQVSESALHVDSKDNLYAVLQGTKYFVVYSPADAHRMYTLGPIAKVSASGKVKFNKNTDQAVDVNAANHFSLVNNGTGILQSYSEFIQEEGLAEMTSCREDIARRFPLFQEATPGIAHLTTSDLLFLPAGWFHQVSSYGQHASINFWFTPSGG